MPSSITLTVSHLPTSTSFFLSALQPLQYIYRGRSGQTIGFGPANSTAQPDFWITQELPGVPAGAAHVAFPASSHAAVQDFFAAALKAGGKIYGEPALRDSYGYYSAAVIDFDGNSIEAVYRPDVSDSDKENIDSRSLVPRKAPTTVVSKTPTKSPSQAPSTTSRKPSPPLTKGDALDRILNEARNTANVARNLVDQVRPNLNSSSSSPNTQTNGNGDGAIVGTLLGVAAGAALTYAFTNRNSPNSSDDSVHSTHSHRDGRGRRPSQVRSNTAPAEHIYPRIESASGASSIRSGSKTRYITLEDNDYASTIKPTRSRSHSRRGSLDSGIGMSPMAGSTASKASRTSKMKMLEAPPSSWRAPSTITPAANTSAKRSSSHSRSSNVSGEGRRRRSSVGSVMDGAKTILHIRETVKRVDSAPVDSYSHSHSTSHSRSQSKSRSSEKSNSKHSRTPSRSRGSTTSKATTIRPEHTPLPPSRAATWANGTSEASFVTAKPTKTVVGKLRDIRRLDVSEAEVRPEDSVSQVSTSVGGRRRR
jgi:hypothetical protein